MGFYQVSRISGSSLLFMAFMAVVGYEYCKHKVGNELNNLGNEAKERQDERTRQTAAQAAAVKYLVIDCTDRSVLGKKDEIVPSQTDSSVNIRTTYPSVGSEEEFLGVLKELREEYGQKFSDMRVTIVGDKAYDPDPEDYEGYGSVSIGRGRTAQVKNIITALKGDNFSRGSCPKALMLNVPGAVNLQTRAQVINLGALVRGLETGQDFSLEYNMSAPSDDGSYVRIKVDNLGLFRIKKSKGENHTFYDGVLGNEADIWCALQQTDNDYGMEMQNSGSVVLVNGLKTYSPRPCEEPAPVR